jgi:hypothetical protein
MSMMHVPRPTRGSSALGLVGLLALSLLPLAPSQAASSAPVNGTTGDQTSSVAQQAALAKAAEALLDRLWHLPPRASQGGVTVCSAAEAELDGDGRPDLIASVDYSGRGFCNTLAVVEKGSPQSVPQVTDAWGLDDVRNAIKPNTDGSLMLAVPTAFTDYEGAECIAVWPRLFELQHGALVDVSTSYPDFYQARKRDVDATIANLDQEQADMSCALIESDKLDRFLGASPTAGYARALAWMRSADPAMRKRAARVFADIGDTVSMANLQGLSHDTDPAVAASAQGGMADVRSRHK